MIRQPPTPLLAMLPGMAYLLLPGHPLGWLSGLPLGPLGLGLLVGLGLVLFATRPHPGAARKASPLVWLLSALCLLKLGIATASPAYGLAASYFAKPGASEPAERSTEFPGLPATRLDRVLSFEDDGFPLYFFNDNVRFNYYREDEPDRESLPFGVIWRGFLEVPSDCDCEFWLTAAGRARLMLAGTPPLAIATGGQIESVSRRARLSAGLVPVEIEYTRRGGEVALLTVEWDSGSGRAILAAPSLLATPTTVPPSPLLWLSRGVDLAYLAAVLGLVALLAPAFAKPAAPSTSSTSPHPRIRELRHPSERAILAGLLAVVFAYAALSSHGLNDRVVLLDGGSDWLTYETYARDILQNGPLMTLGRPLGKGRPYFFQPFYPYALAAAHWLTGEDIYGVVVLQLFGLGVSAVLVYELGKRLFGRLSATFALLCVLLVLGPLQLEWVATRLLSENIFFILLPATALAFIELGRRPSRRLSVLAGLLLGLCCITRGPTLLWIPPLLLIAWSRLRRTSATAPEHSVQNTASAIAGRSAGGRVVGLAALACLAVLLLVPLRNVIVSGQPSPLASNAVSTMELAHPLTPRVDLHDVERNPLYRALRLDYSLIQMIEFVRQDPLGYAATLVPLGLYALGLPGALEPGEPIRWELVALVALYITSFALRPWTIDDRRSTIEENSERSTFYGPSSTVWVLHSFIGLHFVTMMVFLPNSYGYRQVLPMYLFLAIFAGFVLARLTAPLAGLETRASKLIGDGGAQRHRVDQHVPAANTPSRHEKLA